MVMDRVIFYIEVLHDVDYNYFLSSQKISFQLASAELGFRVLCDSLLSSPFSGMCVLHPGTYFYLGFSIQGQVLGSPFSNMYWYWLLHGVLPLCTKFTVKSCEPANPCGLLYIQQLHRKLLAHIFWYNITSRGKRSKLKSMKRRLWCWTSRWKDQRSTVLVTLFSFDLFSSWGKVVRDLCIEAADINVQL